MRSAKGRPESSFVACGEYVELSERRHTEKEAGGVRGVLARGWCGALRIDSAAASGCGLRLGQSGSKLPQSIEALGAGAAGISGALCTPPAWRNLSSYGRLIVAGLLRFTPDARRCRALRGLRDAASQAFVRGANDDQRRPDGNRRRPGPAQHRLFIIPQRGSCSGFGLRLTRRTAPIWIEAKTVVGPTKLSIARGPAIHLAS